MRRTPRKRYDTDALMLTPEWRRLRLMVLARDRYTCWVCGQYADTADHLIPRAVGGSDDLANLAACCRHCNFSRRHTVVDVPVQTVPW